MGSSKIIMLSGIYLILGFYTVGFGVADESNFALASQVATQVQAEQIARTGLSLAMTKVGGTNSVGNRTYSELTASVMNGSVKYKADALSSTQSQITSTGTFNGKTVVVKAVFVYYNSRWRVSRLYVTPTA